MDGSAIEEKIEFIGWLRKATLFKEQRARCGAQPRLGGKELAQLRLKFVYKALNLARDYGLIDEEFFPASLLPNS